MSDEEGKKGRANGRKSERVQDQEKGKVERNEEHESENERKKRVT